jgi:hypothetical protein
MGDLLGSPRVAPLFLLDSKSLFDNFFSENRLHIVYFSQHTSVSLFHMWRDGNYSISLEEGEIVEDAPGE